MSIIVELVQVVFGGWDRVLLFKSPGLHQLAWCRAGGQEIFAWITHDRIDDEADTKTIGGK